jgi:hypothetical protein
MKGAISNMADGIWWEPIVDVMTNVKVNVDVDTGDLVLADVRPVWKQGPLFPLDQFDHFTALLEMAFHGFGGGSARLNELRDPNMFTCFFSNETIYYTFTSLKGFSSSSRRTRKEIERKLPPIIFRYFLLFRSLIQSNSKLFANSAELNLVFPKRFDHSDIRPSHIIRDLFSLSAIP